MSNPPTSPGFVAGQELTAAQLNQGFMAKQDYPAVTMPSSDNSLAVATTAFVHGTIAASVAASNTPPAMDSGSTGVAGSSTAYARGDHVHPSDTSRAALSGATFTGAVTLAADPATALGAVTKQYVDSHLLSANILSFGGVPDGVTDVTPAYNAAVAALQATAGGGGTIFFPSGTWFTKTGLVVASRIHIQGAGESSTTLISDGSHYAILTPWPFAGTQYTDAITYPINAPTQGTNTVTTTNAADAGNFSAGDIIFVAGGLHSTSWWFPSWTTTVASADPSTGIITLTETLPIGGSDVQLVQKALKYPTDIRISDLTVDISPGSVVSGVEINLARNVVIERFTSTTHSTIRHSYVALVSIRDLYVSNSLFVKGYLDCLGCTNANVINNTIQQGIVVWDGGTFNSSFISNTMTDPQVDGSPNSAFLHGSSSHSNRIIGNIINGLAAGVGIGLGGTGGGTPPLTNPYGNNTCIGNTIYGVNTTTTGISAGPSGINNTIIGNNINNIGTGILLSTNSTGNTISGNQFNNVPLPMNVDGTSGIIPVINDVWNIVPDGTTSPNLAFGSLLQTANTSATSITGFTGGIQGQELTLWVNDAFTTLVQGGFLVLQQGVAYSPPAQTEMKFVYRNGVWRELSRSVNGAVAMQVYRGLQVGPGGGGLTVSSIALQAAARKGTLAIDTNNLAYYDPGLTTTAPSGFGGTSGTITTASSAVIAATGTFTLTLPASPLTGAWLYLVSTSAQVVQSASANVVPLAGGAAGTAIFPASAPHWCVLQYNGTNWITFASDASSSSGIADAPSDGWIYARDNAAWLKFGRTDVNNNWFFGLAGNTTVIGSNNTGIGFSALLNVAGGQNNEAMGINALRANTTGSQNIALGTNTMLSNASGNNNVAVGHTALGNATANNNTGVGYAAIWNVVGGVSNTALGYSTGATVVSGSHNLILGDSVNLTSDLSGCIAIGNTGTVYLDYNMSTANQWTTTASLQMRMAGPSITMNIPAAGTARAIASQTNGSFRWNVVIGDNTAESGSNAGSNFGIQRWSDTSTFIDTPLIINRATGQVTLSQTLKMAASAAAAGASMNLPSGVAPTAPVSGDMWFDGTHLYIRIGATTTTIV